MLIAGILAAGLAGCIERRLHVTSEPAGAVVQISGEEVGRTPVSRPFTWYGDYEIILRLDGHESVITHAEIQPPVYAWPGLDLLSALAPWTYHDDRYLHYELQPLDPPSQEELLRRAEALRERNLEPVR